MAIKHLLLNLRNKAGLVLSVLQHKSVGVISNSKQMWRHLSLPLSSELGNNLTGVDGKTFVGINSYTEQAGVGLQGVIGNMKNYISNSLLQYTYNIHIWYIPGIYIYI